MVYYLQRITNHLLVPKYLTAITAFGYSIALLILSLVKIGPVVPKLGSDFDDKIYHAIAYIIMGFVWGVYFLRASIKNYLFQSFAIGALFGIIIEVLQVTITSYRSFDLFDILANVIGLCLGLVIVSVLKIRIINLK